MTAPKQNTVTVDSTDLDKLRVRVAELCRWKVISYTARGLEWFGLVSPREQKWHGFSTAEIAWSANVILDYPRDLNACTEFEKLLEGNQRLDYVRHLTTIMDGWNMMPDFTTTFATATQRCLAFVALHEASDPTLGADSVPEGKENL